MTELQDANWAKVEDEVRVNAQRLLWRTKLIRGDRLPVRELLIIAQRAIADFHDATLSAGLNDLPKTEMAKFVDSADAWLARMSGRLFRLANEENEQC
jgi:hypothetical protein